MIVELLQRALDHGIAARRATELHLITKVIPSSAANNTFLTRSLRFHQYSVTDLEFSDILPDGGDFACCFVTQDQRFFHNIDSVAAVLEIVHIGAADSCGA